MPTIGAGVVKGRLEGGEVALREAAGVAGVGGAGRDRHGLVRRWGSAGLAGQGGGPPSPGTRRGRRASVLLLASGGPYVHHSVVGSSLSPDPPARARGVSSSSRTHCRNAHRTLKSLKTPAGGSPGGVLSVLRVLCSDSDVVWDGRWLGKTQPRRQRSPALVDGAPLPVQRQQPPQGSPRPSSPPARTPPWAAHTAQSSAACAFANHVGRALYRLARVRASGSASLGRAETSHPSPSSSSTGAASDCTDSPGPPRPLFDQEATKEGKASKQLVML